MNALLHPGSTELSYKSFIYSSRRNGSFLFTLGLTKSSHLTNCTNADWKLKQAQTTSSQTSRNVTVLMRKLNLPLKLTFNAYSYIAIPFKKVDIIYMQLPLPLFVYFLVNLQALLFWVYWLFCYWSHNVVRSPPF